MVQPEGTTTASVGNGASAGVDGQQPAPPQRTWGGTFKSFMFQMVIFYIITSFFRGNKTPPEAAKGPDGEPLALAGINLFSKGDKLVRNKEYLDGHVIDFFSVSLIPE